MTYCMIRQRLSSEKPLEHTAAGFQWVSAALSTTDHTVHFAFEIRETEGNTTC